MKDAVTPLAGKDLLEGLLDRRGAGARGARDRDMMLGTFSDMMVQTLKRPRFRTADERSLIISGIGQ
jgi:hypothetical protein